MLSLKNKLKNFIKKIKGISTTDAIEIVISIASIVLVLFTLFEMQKERNMAYLPDIVLSNTTIAISWDKDGLPYISDEAKAAISKVTSDNTTDINILPQMKIYNIGVGTAKDISLTWNSKKNIEQLIDTLSFYDDIDVSRKENILYLKTHTMEQAINIIDTSRIRFLLNSTQEFDTSMFPVSYYQLIREICLRIGVTKIPPLYLSISFSDVQGRVYNKSMQINAENLLLSQNSDGSGYCVFKLISEQENTNMHYFNLSNDDLTAIASFFAVVVSVISMGFSVIFSILQVKHNKNSVKPISAIQTLDYENNIAVKIANVGTGPLTIKKLIAKNDLGQASDLISIMPEIDQLWYTFTEPVDGWTIPVNEKIVLLEIYPENDAIKTLIRKTLAKTTIFIEYTDIYNTTFKDEKSLDFFGRHYE